MLSCKERQAKRRANINKDEDESEGHPICAVSLCVGQWVVVDYDGEDGPGEMTCCNGDDQCEVSVMHKSGNLWKWPKVVCKRQHSAYHLSSKSSRTTWTVPYGLAMHS